MKKKVLLFSLVLLLALGLVITGCPAPVAPVAPAPVEPVAPVVKEWPTRHIEFVIMAGLGGGADRYARQLTAVNYVNSYLPGGKQLMPINRSGGAGAVAMDYVLKQKGDGYTIMMTLNSYICTPIEQKLPFSYKDYTNIVLLATDNFPLWVHKDTPWKTWEEFLATAMERSIVASMTGVRQEDEVIFRLIEQYTGCKPFTLVPYAGGGDVATALAGQHVECNVNQVSEFAPYYPDFGRALVVFQPERLNITVDPVLATLNEVRSSYEVGVPIYYRFIRMLVGPPGMPAEAVAGIISFAEKATTDPMWIEFVDFNALNPLFVTGAELMEYLDDIYAENLELFLRLGWAK